MDNEDKMKKDAFSLKKLEEMKKNNEKILQRHLDVQNDRIAAERNNASITNLHKRKQTVKEEEQRSKEISYTREWDRGKEIDLWKFDNDRAIKNSGNWYKTRTKNWKGQDHRESDSQPKSQTFKMNRKSRRYNSTHDDTSSTEESYDKNPQIKRSNMEKFWRKDSEDANKKERTITWVKSQRKSDSKNESPKKKYYEFDNNEKCRLQKQEICEEKAVNRKSEPLKGYSKFDRYDKSEKSSTSDTSENIAVVKEPVCISKPECMKEKTKKYKVKDVSQSDDGGWSTVEEGEIISGDSDIHE